MHDLRRVYENVFMLHVNDTVQNGTQATSTAGRDAKQVEREPGN